MDDFKIDSHKLNFHPERVAAWRAGENIYPIYMEVSPIGLCNHRCVFCGLDFMGYKNARLELKRAETLLPELGYLGLKSIMYAGEGEPLLHPDMCRITELTKTAGIDVAFTTNGTLMTPDKAEVLLKHSTWIKISCNGGDEESYFKIHRGKRTDFEKMFENLRAALTIRREKHYDCTLGLQLVLVPENQGSVTNLARLAAEAGADYLVIKPFSQHTQSINRQYENLEYDGMDALEKDLKQYETETFKVIFRRSTMERWNHREKNYRKCLALPFWSYIDSSGNVWGCSMFLGNEKFLYGNIYENSFEEIWTGSKRRESLNYVQNELNIHECRINCRMDKINSYLWEMQNPSGHVNFI